MLETNQFCEIFEKASLPIREADILAITEPAGGTYNYVYRIDTTKGNYIWKQAKERLKSDVFSSVHLDPYKRLAAEYSVANVYRSVLGDDVVPTIYYFDQQLPGLLMKAFDGHLLKDELLQGQLRSDPLIKIGYSLGKVHAATRFINNDPIFVNEQAREAELRTHYFDMLDHFDNNTKRKLTDLAISHRASRECLIHADLTSRSVIVDGDNIHFIDFELAHLGSPSYDIGHFLPEYMLAGIGCNDGNRVDVFEVFLNAYFSGNDAVNKGRIIRGAYGHSAALMFFRIDGMARTDFLHTEEQRERARKKAGKLMLFYE